MTITSVVTFRNRFDDTWDYLFQGATQAPHCFNVHLPFYQSPKLSPLPFNPIYFNMLHFPCFIPEGFVALSHHDLALRFFCI